MASRDSAAFRISNASLFVHYVVIFRAVGSDFRRFLSCYVMFCLIVSDTLGNIAIVANCRAWINYQLSPMTKVQSMANLGTELNLKSKLDRIVPAYHLKNTTSNRSCRIG